MAGDGSWLLVRSDRLIISIATPGVRYYIGRGRQLPAAQQLTAKYISNEHLCVVLSADKSRLDVFQVGKNPTFCGAGCVKLKTVSDTAEMTTPSLQITLTPDGQPDREAAHPSDADSPVVMTVSPTMGAAATAPPARSDTAGAVLHFPDELGLPTMVVRFEGGATHHASHGTAEDASKASLSVPQMLSVPTAAALLDAEEELDDAPTRLAGSGGGPKPEWQGLLDVALQQQQQRENLSTTTAPPPALAPLAPAAAAAAADNHKRARSPQHKTPSPAAVPTTLPEPTRTAEPAVKAPKVEPVPAAVADTRATAATAIKMGFWEWKCHADGKDSNPKSWRKYPLGIAHILEDAYRSKASTVDLPDRVLRNDPAAGEKECTYAVCFNEASLKDTMIQYQKSDPARFRTVRRTGGDDVDRHGVKKKHVIPSSSSEESESELDSDSEDSSVSSDSDSGSSD